MNPSRSFNTEEFRCLQLRFANFVGDWVKKEPDYTEGKTVDLPDAVNLLQILGYHLTRIDGYRPMEFTPLTGGKKGTRINLSCNYSGQRCYMEQACEESDCNCVRVLDDESKEDFWEITATTPSQKGNSLLASGSRLIPPVSAETTQVIRPMIMQLIRMMHYLDDDKTEPLSTASCSFDSLSTSSVDVPTISSSLTHVSPLSGSPSRYRSLDTLTAVNLDLAFGEAKSLSEKSSSDKQTSLATQYTSEDVSLQSLGHSLQTLSEYPVSFLKCPQSAYNLLTIAADSLKGALEAIDKTNGNEEKVSSESAGKDSKATSIKSAPAKVFGRFFKPQPPKSISSPNLGQKPKPTTMRTPKSSNDTFIAKRSVMSASKVKTPTSTSTSGPSTSRITNAPMYGHVATTIPKAEPIKRKSTDAVKKK